MTRPTNGLAATSSATSTTFPTRSRATALAVSRSACIATIAAICAATPLTAAEPADVPALPGTDPLPLVGDIASHLVAGVDKFLLRKLDESVDRRARHWNRDLSSAEAYNSSIEPNRSRLAHILGVRDARVAFDAPERITTVGQNGLVGKGNGYSIYAVRWPVLEDPDPLRTVATIYGEGLLIVPDDKQAATCDVIAIPDADQTPEQLAGLTDGIPPERQFARLAALNGCRVLVPSLVSRQMSKRNNRANLTDREFLYRSGFELGHHLIGYEVQKVLALVDWFAKDAAIGGGENADPHIAVMGYGEGGMIALYAAALDTRIDSVLVSGYFSNRNSIWHQPIDRNVFGLLDQFGDAELLSMVFPRSWVVEAGGGPKVSLPGEGGAPAILLETDPDEAEAEWKRYTALVADAAFESRPKKFTRRRGDGPASFYHDSLSPTIAYAGGPDKLVSFPEELPRQVGTMVEGAQRQKRQVDQIDQYNQLLLIESPYVRAEYMKELYDAANTKDLAAYQPVVDKYRDRFYADVVGRFDDELLPPRARSRKSYETDKWTGYEVVLDVWPDVIAYGILLVPKGMVDGEKRPVVVCQHGLEGRPQHVIEGDHGAYHDYAAKLAERGFITFAPQNLYIFQDRFRTLQRKANPLGKTLFSVIVPQHQQIVDWLETLPYVDPERIAFYGLSYGGKSAMRIPALVPD